MQYNSFMLLQDVMETFAKKLTIKLNYRRTQRRKHNRFEGHLGVAQRESFPEFCGV